MRGKSHFSFPACPCTRLRIPFDYSVSVSLSMSDKPECRWVMPAGSCTVSSTESSLMVRCPATSLLARLTTASTLSSVRPAAVNTFPELCLSILSQLWSVSQFLLKHEYAGICCYWCFTTSSIYFTRVFWIAIYSNDNGNILLSLEQWNLRIFVPLIKNETILVHGLWLKTSNWFLHLFHYFTSMNWSYKHYKLWVKSKLSQFAARNFFTSIQVVILVN